MMEFVRNNVIVMLVDGMAMIVFQDALKIV
jgi:hypothetical protein